MKSRKQRAGDPLYQDWIVPVLIIAPPKRPDALRDIIPLLRRLHRAFGTRSVALLLNVRSADVRRWRKRRESITPTMRDRILDLHDVFTRLFRLYHPRAAFHWLTAQERLLGGARPLDVLTSRGAAPLIDVLRAIETGSSPHTDIANHL